jgi:hypothetical protein
VKLTKLARRARGLLQEPVFPYPGSQGV